MARDVLQHTAMAVARHFTELICWQLADELRRAVHDLARRDIVRRDRHYHEQFVDAAASAPRNIAEGFGRHTDADFAHFLDVARASLNETQDHLIDGVTRGYLARHESARLMTLARRSAAAVAGLQRSLRRRQRKHRP